MKRFVHQVVYWYVSRVWIPFIEALMPVWWIGPVCLVVVIALVAFGDWSVCR
jgi:hypothetical protein